MKKTVKSLIIAASVAAIAGIGAVSFAAWSNNADVTSQEASGYLGNIEVTAGSIVVDDNNLTSTVTLVPYDQTEQYDSSTQKKMQTFTVAYDNTTNGGAPVTDYTYKMSYAVKKEEGESTARTLSLYYKIGASVTAPAATVAVADLTNETNGWKVFTGDVALELDKGTQTVNIILVSSDPADMGHEYTITIAATRKSA